MILDLCGNWRHYASGNQQVYEQAFAFLASLKPDCGNGRHEIDGNNMYAIVQSYDTKDLNAGKIETHHRYIDIQTLLSGHEQMFYAPANVLEICNEYNADNDAAFYRYAAEKTFGFSLTPGFFAMFFPDEGHMPGIAGAAGPVPVRKVVIKIAAKLLTTSIRK
ncbi:MAG: YhcH/YjgK/YiaL family protein [Victivallales bacterium]|nr:YhcH/YjgK/YiaL family protein [Victivallales bacterium]